MDKVTMGKPTETENFTISTVVIVLGLSLVICAIYQDKNNHSLEGLTTLLAGCLWIMGVLTGTYTFLRHILPGNQGPGKVKKGIQQFLCIAAIVVTLWALWTVVKMPLAACIAERQVIQKLVIAFPDSVRLYVNQLPVDEKDDEHQSVKARALEFRKDALDRAITAAGVTTECRSCYYYLLDSIRTDTLAIWCSMLDTLNAIGAEWMALQRAGDIRAIPPFLARHGLQNARILQSVNHQFMIIGGVSGFMKDAIQLNKPVRLLPVHNDDPDTPDRHGVHIDFVIES